MKREWWSLWLMVLSSCADPWGMWPGGLQDWREAREVGDSSTDVDPDTSDDTVGETRIDEVSYTCNSSADTFSYDVSLIGWGEIVVMDIAQDTTSPWEEHHELQNTEYDEDGQWDRWQLELEITEDWASVVSSESTLFGNDLSCPCGGGCYHTMVWRVQAYDPEGVVDCVVFAESDGDPELLMQAGCRVIEVR